MANTTTDLYLKKLRQKYKEKGATEQEAETLASQNQSQQEAQATQNQELNGWQQFGLGVGQFADSVAKTFLDLGEGLVDAHAFAVGSVAEWVGDQETAKNARGFIEYDATEKIMDTVVGKENRDFMKQQDVLPDVLDSIASGIGSSLGMGALSSIPYAGWALTGMAAGGASAEQELKNNPDLDISSAMGYGIINGAVEVASELLVGKVLGWIGKGINKAVGGSAVSETATRFGLGSSTGGNILTNLIKEFNEEGVEEVVSELVDPIARKLTIEKDKSWEETFGTYAWDNREYWIDDVWTAYWQGGLSSVVMGGTGATVNTIKAGGVRNYNAVLQVRAVAEVNEQIKELEAKNTNGRYDNKITALEAQKQNIINNFQKNFEEFARDYLKAQNDDYLTKKEVKKASIYEGLQQQQNRDVRKELAVESAIDAGAFEVQFSEDGSPSYAIKEDNFINYNGEKLSTKDWLKTVIHEIGHINVNDIEFVNSILQDVSAEDLQKSENEYVKRYGDTYNDANVRKTDLYNEYRKQGLNYKEAISKARQQMIREEIAMDRLASMFNNQAEFKRAINGEKLSLIERLKDKFINTYKHVKEVQKPKNYNQIIKYLQEAIKQTKERRETLTYEKINQNEKDVRYKISDETDNQGKKLSKEQQEYFKDSKVRDENGNLIAVYHGTVTPGFTEFNTNKNDFHINWYKDYENNVINFFTSSKQMSKSYVDFNSKKIFNPYENKISSLDVLTQLYNSYKDFEKGKKINKLTFDFLGSKYKAIDNALEYNKEKIYIEKAFFDKLNITPKQNYLKKFDNQEYYYLGTHQFADLSGHVDFVFNPEYKEYFSGGIYKEYLNIVNPYEIDNKGRSRGHIFDPNLEDGIGSVDDIVEMVLELNKKVKKQYDGIIIKNISDYGGSFSISFDENNEFKVSTNAPKNNKAADIYVTLKSPNQIKDINNLKPTIDNDIRYEISDEDWDKSYKDERAELKEKFGENINYKYTYELYNNLQEKLNKADKNGEYEDLEKAPKAKMAIKFLEVYRNYSETLSSEFEDVLDAIDNAKQNNNVDEVTSLYLKYKSLLALAQDAMDQVEEINYDVDREGDYDNYTDKIAEANEQRIDEAQEIVDEILDNIESYEDISDDIKEFVEKANKEIDNNKKELKEKTDENVNQRGTETTSKGITGNTSKISEGSTRSGIGESRGVESKTEGNVVQSRPRVEAVEKQVGQDIEREVRLSGGRRDTLLNAKNGYDSKLRGTSNKGRGRDRISNLYEFGELIRDNRNIATKPKSINGETYTVIFDDYLPTYLQDMKNELQKIKIGDKNLQVYFYVSDSTDTRNGFTVEDTIMVRLDSTMQNTAIHEFSHVLSDLVSKAYAKAHQDVFNYLLTNQNEQKELTEKFEGIYKKKFIERYLQQVGVKKYNDLDPTQKATVDNNVKKMISEELFCAVIQGKTKLKDRAVHNKIINDYLANIKIEYGIDLAPYYYSDFIDIDEVRVKPEDIKMSKYIPIEVVEPNSANKQKGLELFSDYVDAINAQIEKFRTSIDKLEASTNFEKMLSAYEKLNAYKQNISRDFKNLDNYATEWKNIYSEDFEPLQKKLNEAKKYFIEYAEKFVATKERPSLLQNVTSKVQDLEIKDKYQKEKAELIKDLRRDSFAGNEEFLKRAQNIAEWIELKYDEAMDKVKEGYYSSYYQYFKKQIDALWSDFNVETERVYSNIQQGNESKLAEEAKEKRIKKRLKRGDATYSKADEAKRLNELKEQLKSDLQKVENVTHQYNKLIKSQKSIYLSRNIEKKNIDKEHQPLGKKAKINLHEKLVKYINDLTSAINDYKKAVEDLTKGEVFRTAEYNKALFETINTLERTIGTTLDEKTNTLYGLKNTLYTDVAKATKSAEERYAEKLSKQDAETKKEIKDTIKDIERNIPNQANDFVEVLQEQIDKYTDLKMQYEGQSELLEEAEKTIKELKEKVKKAKSQTSKAVDNVLKRVEIWKNKWAEERATVKDLKEELKRYQKEILENQDQDKVNLKAETKDYSEKYTKLEQKLKNQKELNKKVGAELKEKKAEYKKKVSEVKSLTNKINNLRKKLVLETINGKSIVRVDNNFYSFVNEILGNDISKSLSDSDMQKLGVAFSAGDFESFSSILTEALEAKGYDTMLMALELGDSLYYEDNFIDLFEAAFLELNNYQNNEFTNVGKLMVRLANAKTDYNLLKEAYRADMTIRQAQVRAKSFTKFFAENTKNNSSRLNGVDSKYREALIKFVKDVREFDNLESFSNGELRVKIIDFLKTLKSEYNGKIEVNGIALDSGIVNMLDTLENLQRQSQEYIEDLQATAEEAEKKAKNKEKISKYEAKLYRDFFSGIKKFTDEVMHNRYWEIGNLTIKGTEFTQTLVNQVYRYKKAIKQLNWHALSKMYVSPRNIFREISAYDNNSYVMQLYNELEKGTIRTMQAKMDLAKPLKEFFDKNKKFRKELEVDSKKYEHTIEYGDEKSFTASTTLLLDFYEAIQNENNRQHILNDGVEFGNVDPIKISEEELLDIEKAIKKEFDLYDENSVYAQYIELLNTMYEKAKQLKIETDIRMRGFSNVQEGFYYPTSVSDYNLNIDLSKGAYDMGNTYGGADLVTTERSFNKDLKSNRGAIKIVNSYQKMLNHINGMASYYGVDTAILNFSKMYRYRVEGGISSGNAIRQLFGNDSKNFDKYLGELFKDMRGTNNPMTGTDATINSIEKVLRSGVVTATLVNPKVIATQPASLLTAMKYISPKHILSSLKEGFVLTSKYPPLPTAGAYRYFDQSALQAETGGVDNKFQKTLGKGISAGDHFAINIEWAACCKQVGLLEFKKGSTEYNEALKKAEELFNRVVFDTQPNNNALGKAEIMRSDNEIVKLLTMYRSQAMQNFNIAYDAINQLKTIHKLIKAENITGERKKMMLAGPRKELARALASLILEGMLFTFIGQLFAHFVNNDWDDEDFWANATKDFGVAYFNDNVLGILPVLNKLQVEIEDKLSVSANNITMGWLENLVDSIQNLISKPSPKQFVQLFSYGTGIPLATNYKYTKAIVQYISPEFAYQFDAIYNGVDTSTKSAINYALNDKQYSKAYELYKTYNSNSVEFETKTLEEMFNLYKKGYTDVAVKSIPDNISYNGETIKIDKKKFKDIYSKVAKKINPLIKSGAYKKMTDEKKSLVIKYLLNTYYNIAKKSFTGQDMSFIEKIFYADYNLSPNLLLQIYDIQNMQSDEKGQKKAKIEAYIRKSSNYQAEKYFLQMTSGYSLNDEYKNFVISYLTNKGLGWKKAKEIVWS